MNIFTKRILKNPRKKSPRQLIPAVVFGFCAAIWCIGPNWLLQVKMWPIKSRPCTYSFFSFLCSFQTIGTAGKKNNLKILSVYCNDVECFKMFWLCVAARHTVLFPKHTQTVRFEPSQTLEASMKEREHRVCFDRKRNQPFCAESAESADCQCKSNSRSSPVKTLANQHVLSGTCKEQQRRSPYKGNLWSAEVST